MRQQRSDANLPGKTRTTRATTRAFDPERVDVTDIIPFNEFGDLGDVDFREHTAFDPEAQVVHSPELDDMHDADDLTPLRRGTRLSSPPRRDARRARATAVRRHRDHRHLPRTPQHRRQPTSAAKGRVMIVAMAAGAAAAAAYTAIKPAGEHDHPRPCWPPRRLHRRRFALPRAACRSSPSQPVADAALHSEELSKGAAFAQERAEREARLQRPLFVMPTKGVFTSGFGYRWGALHAGIDLAGPIGTPIYAVSDGVVVDAGPTAGFGAWVKIRHADGSVSLYGHVNTWTVQIGQRVFAGDQIATIGNRGNSTGPHLHFSVLQNGTNYIDPVPWLAARGLSLGPYVG